LKLYDKVCNKEHILASFHQIKERWFDPHLEYFQQNAVGIDGLELEEFEKDLKAQLELCREFLLDPGRDYYPQILVRIPKKDPGKFRDIYLLTVRDKVIHKCISTPLEQILDRSFYPNLYAFRRGKYYGSMAAARKVRQYLDGSDHRSFVLKTDIHEYFDSIHPGILLDQFKSHLPEEKEIHVLLEKFLHQRRFVKGVLNSSILGVPTGSSLSPLCANLYLNELDRQMFRGGFQYLRYCDDLLLLSTDLKEVEAGKRIIQEVLSAHRVKLSEKKTKLYEPGQPFDYLGYRFADRKIHIGESSMKTFRDWVYDLFPRDRYREYPNETVEERRSLLKKILIDMNTGKLAENGESSINRHQIPWIRSFPIVSSDQSFRNMDRFIKDRIRMLVTGKVSPKNHETVPEAWFRELGYKSLTGAYYRITHRRSMAPYIGWRRYFGSNFELFYEGKEKRTGLKRKWHNFKTKLKYVKKALNGEL